MKIIFLKDVAGVAQKCTVKTVADGYAQHLLKSGVAELATPAKLANLKDKQKASVAAAQQNSALIAAAIDAAAETTLEITAKANEKGHFFEGVTAHKVHAALKEVGVDVPESVIVMEPIKEVGEYTIGLHFEKKKGACTLHVHAA